MRRIVTDLPAELVKKLNETARKYRRTRETIVAIACQDWIDDAKYRQIRQEIARSAGEDRVSGGSQG